MLDRPKFALVADEPVATPALDKAGPDERTHSTESAEARNGSTADPPDDGDTLEEFEVDLDDGDDELSAEPDAEAAA